MNCRTESLRSRSRGLFAAMLALVSACSIALSASVAMAGGAPTIDGNLADFISFGEQLNNNNTGFGVAITDKPDVNGVPQVETIYSDPKIGRASCRERV